jgi:hypothetical protein
MEPQSETELREQAVTSLKKKRDFKSHLFIYIAVNVLLVVIWAVTSDGFFWPIFVIGGWGIGLADHGIRDRPRDRPAPRLGVASQDASVPDPDRQPVAGRVRSTPRQA